MTEKPKVKASVPLYGPFVTDELSEAQDLVASGQYLWKGEQAVGGRWRFLLKRIR